jgi:hypothetical protein
MAKKNAAVEKAIKEIEHVYYFIGGSSESSITDPLTGETLRATSAVRTGVSTVQLKKAREFNHAFRREELEEICRECRKCEFPLDIGIILRVLAVEGRERRKLLILKAIREKWTLDWLNSVIQAIGGPPKRAGRPKDMPEGPEDARRMIIEHFGSQLAWLRTARAHAKGKFFSGLEDETAAAITALDVLVGAALGIPPIPGR